MSKSLGNFVTISDVLEKFDANTIRFFILTNNYRMPIEFSDEGLRAAKAGVQRLKNTYDDIKNVFNDDKIQEGQRLTSATINELALGSYLPFHSIDEKHYLEEKIPAEIMEKIIKELKSFINAMDDDFNTSKIWSHFLKFQGVPKRKKHLKILKIVFFISLFY